MPKIQILTEIQADRKIVFDLSRSIDLHKISTEHTNEEAIAGKITGLIELHESVTWRAKHFGFYQLLTSKITAFESPDYFVDEMVSGAFKWFRHTHRFTAHGQRTLMTDTFEYESPFGFLGKIADKIFLEKYMKTLLEKRNGIIKKFAESDRWKSVI